MTVFKQISSRSGGSIETETYRGIPITYLKSKSDATPETGAYATVNDVVVLTLSREQLHTAINAALDGQNLAAQANYTDVMSTLPNQTAGAMYMDYNRYSDLLQEMNRNLSSAFDKLDPGLDPAQAEEFKQQRENLQRQQEAQLAQLREMMKAMGGIGATMSYEPTGIRFDMTAQQDVNKLPEAWRKFYEAQQTPSPNRIFGALPADTIMAADVSLNSSIWDFFFSPDYLNMVLSSLPVDKRDNVLTQPSAPCGYRGT